MKIQVIGHLIKGPRQQQQALADDMNGLILSSVVAHRALCGEPLLAPFHRVCLHCPRFGRIALGSVGWLSRFSPFRLHRTAISSFNFPIEVPVKPPHLFPNLQMAATHQSYLQPVIPMRKASTGVTVREIHGSVQLSV